MIIWLASYPRSGNTLLLIILNASFGRRIYYKHDDTLDIGADPRTADAVGHAPLDAPWHQAYPAFRDSPDPVFVKTHDAPEDDAKAIYVVRDGRSACVSFHHYLKDFTDYSFQPTVTDVILGFTPFGSWGSHLDNWDPARRPNTLFLKYEDIVRDPARAIQLIADFTGLTPVRTWENNFDELHRINPKFFRAGAATPAAGVLSPVQEELFQHHHADWMGELGYETAPVPVAAGSQKVLRTSLSERGKKFYAMLDRQRALQGQANEAWSRAQASKDAAVHASAQLSQASALLSAADARADALQSRLDTAEKDIARLRDALAGARAFADAVQSQATDLTRLARDTETRLVTARRRLTEAARRATRAESHLDPFLRSRIYQTLWAVGAVRKPGWVDEYLAPSSATRADLSFPPPPPGGGDGLAATSAALERLSADTADRLRAAIEGRQPPSGGVGAALPSKPTEMDLALRHLVVDKGFRPRAILDVGSAKGYWSERAHWLYFPDADYYMIDPLDESQGHLQELAGRSPQFRPLQLAIGGEPGQLDINVAPDGDGSSLLAASNPAANIRAVPVETLDRLLDDGRIVAADLVKIDVQGFEIEVLRGATKLFGQTDIFIIEVNLFRFMPGCPLAHEVVAFMADRGYLLYDLAGTLRRPYQGDMGQMDLVFVRNDSPLVASNRWK
jgi:FkbM family methyltransferase